MRLIRLIALASPLIMLLPLSAQAAWPAGVRESYMKDCVSSASKSVDQKSAETLCACGANKLNEKFTTTEISELMSKTKQPSAELQTKALEAIQECRVKK